MKQYFTAILYFDNPVDNRIYNYKKLSFLFRTFESYFQEELIFFEVKTFQSHNDSENWLPFNKLTLNDNSSKEISTKFLTDQSNNVIHFDTHLYLREGNKNSEPKAYIGIKNNKITKGSLDDIYNDFLSIHFRCDLFKLEMFNELLKDICENLKPIKVYFLKLPWHIEDELLGTIEDELDLNSGYSYIIDGKSLTLDKKYNDSLLKINFF